jgi:aryl-alcohol dehydrogenase-like predicted oxidoreductase
MNQKKDQKSMNRREFNKSIITVAAGAPLLMSGDLVANVSGEQENKNHRNERTSMTYKKLGRTNFMSSRLVFGCGAALSGGKGVRLLDRTFEAGINHYDVGSDVAYRGSEQSLAPFFKEHRGDIWVTSKAPLSRGVQQDDQISTEQAKSMAETWSKLLDQSLTDLETEYIDAYYLMGINNPSIISSEEIYKAFLDAKAAGKVGYFGLSTHNNAQKVLEAAIETGWYDLAMIGITPAGWYDWKNKVIEKNTPPLVALQPILNKAKAAGIGLVGMKTVRYMAAMQSGGKSDAVAFDKFYNNKLLESQLTPFQRAYAFALENGMDVVNTDAQNFEHLEENIVAAATSHTYFS